MRRDFHEEHPTSEGGTNVKNQVFVQAQTARPTAGRSLRMAASAAMAWLLAAALVLTGAPAPAHAAENETEAAPATVALSGVDFMQPSAEAWEVLRVDGLEGASLYLDVEKNEGDVTTPLIGRMEYRSADEADGAGNAVAQIVALNLQGATPAEALGDAEAAVTYTVRVYDEPRGGDMLYEGTVYPVYAQLLDGDTVDGYELVGIRTASAAELSTPKNFGVGATFYKKAADDEGNDVTSAYSLQATDKADNRFDESLRAFVVPFQKDADDAVKGSVRYVTLDGNVVRTDAVTSFDNGAASVAIEKSFVEKGRYYRAISNLSGTTVTLTAANAHAIVRVVEVAEMAEKDYSVTIRYVDEDDELLWSDTLDIHGYGYQYTLPTSFSMVETDGVNFYSLDEVEGAEGETDEQGRAAVRDWGAPTIKFDYTVDPDAHFLIDENKDYYLNAKYVSSDVTRKATLALVAVDGSTGRLLPDSAQPGSFEVTPDREARYMPTNKVIDGVTYVPWSGNAEEIVYGWDDLAAGVDLRQYVYYVPEGYAPDAPYDVTVQYMDIADSRVLRTETVTIEPETNGFTTIVGPERFAEGGNDYVRLSGQETGIRHSYFTPTRTYTIYYRDVNDVINADTVIRRTQIVETERVVEVPGETTFATTLTAAPVTVPAAAGADGADGAAVDAGVAAGDGATVINDDDNPLANQAGQDTTTERTIEDNETPMAAGAEPGSESLLSNLGLGFAVGAGIAALAAAGVAAFIWLRRKNDKKTAGVLAETDKLNE